MNKSLLAKNRNKHINSVAKDFMCAIIGSSQYWNVHSAQYSFGETIEKCFAMAEQFVNNEKQ